MINLSKLRLLFLPSPRRTIHLPHFRVRNPHLIFGIILMVMLIAILLALPATAGHQPAYLTVHPSPGLAHPAAAPTGLAADPAWEIHPVIAQPAILLPVTGK